MLLPEAKAGAVQRRGDDGPGEGGAAGGDGTNDPPGGSVGSRGVDVASEVGDFGGAVPGADAVGVVGGGAAERVPFAVVDDTAAGGAFECGGAKRGGADGGAFL